MFVKEMKGEEFGFVSAGPRTLSPPGLERYLMPSLFSPLEAQS